MPVLLSAQALRVDRTRHTQHPQSDLPQRLKPVSLESLSIEHGTHKTVKARFWPWLLGKSTQKMFHVKVILGREKRDTGIVNLIGLPNKI